MAKANDLKGIYIPVGLISVGLTFLIINDCVGSTVEGDETGPTGSEALCAWGLLMVPILWVPVGVVLVLLQVLFRWNGTRSGRSDALRLKVGGIVFVVLLAFSVVTNWEEDLVEMLFTLLASIVVNLVPTLVFSLIGQLVVKLLPIQPSEPIKCVEAPDDERMKHLLQ